MFRRVTLVVSLFLFLDVIWCGYGNTILDMPYTCGSGFRRVDNNLVPDYYEAFSYDCAINHMYDYASDMDLSTCLESCSSNIDCFGFVYVFLDYFGYYSLDGMVHCWLFACDNFSVGAYQVADPNYHTFFKESDCTSDVLYHCYPNGTVAVTNPRASVFTHAMAVQNQGLSVAHKCTVAMNGAQILITDCSMDTLITLFLSDRDNGDDDLFVGQTKLSVGIECKDLPSEGVERTVVNSLGAILEVTTQDAVTPSFTISSAIRSGSPTGAIVTSAVIGEELYWTIDIPDDYRGRPTCTAYSGSSGGLPSQQLILDGCSTDVNLVGNFDNEVTPAALVKRLWTTLFAFKFYNNDFLYLECSVKLCPASSNQCDFACDKKKRSLADQWNYETPRLVKTNVILHIYDNGAHRQGAGALLLGTLLSVAVLWKLA